jgi:hypothetical protein
MHLARNESIRAALHITEDYTTRLTKAQVAEREDELRERLEVKEVLLRGRHKERKMKEEALRSALED